MLLDGYYYYFRTSSSTAVKGRTYWITLTNGLLPAGEYAFDDSGKMINPPAVDPDPTPDPDPDPKPDPNPDPDPDPDPEVPDIKNGIVAENGSLYYYVNGLRTGVKTYKIRRTN